MEALYRQFLLLVGKSTNKLTCFKKQTKYYKFWKIAKLFALLLFEKISRHEGNEDNFET